MTRSMVPNEFDRWCARWVSPIVRAVRVPGYIVGVLGLIAAMSWALATEDDRAVGLAVGASFVGLAADAVGLTCAVIGSRIQARRGE